MDHYINLYSYGRKTIQHTWGIDLTYSVNRLYYVNAGSAILHLGNRTFPLRRARSISSRRRGICTLPTL